MDKDIETNPEKKDKEVLKLTRQFVKEKCLICKNCDKDCDDRDCKIGWLEQSLIKSRKVIADIEQGIIKIRERTVKARDEWKDANDKEAEDICKCVISILDEIRLKVILKSKEEQG